MDKIISKVNDIIGINIKGRCNINPVGHHDLGRHYVYCLIDDFGKEYILKIYGREGSWCNEITTLKLFGQLKFTPNIVNYGILEDNTKWVLLEKIQGIVLDKIWDDLNDFDKKNIVKELGQYLGKIHSFTNYNYYGLWYECGGSPFNTSDFMKYRLNKDRIILRDILVKEIPNKDLLLLAYNQMIQCYDKIGSEDVARICHHDYCGRNIIVLKDNGKWKISGIIDYEHCYPDDPYIDIANLYHKIFIDNPQLKHYFFEGYTEFMGLSPKNDIKIKYYLLYLSIQISSWAYECAYDYYEKCIQLLKKIID